MLWTTKIWSKVHKILSPKACSSKKPLWVTSRDVVAALFNEKEYKSGFLIATQDALLIEIMGTILDLQNPLLPQRRLDIYRGHREVGLLLQITLHACQPFYHLHPLQLTLALRHHCKVGKQSREDLEERCSQKASNIITWPSSIPKRVQRVL